MKMTDEQVEKMLIKNFELLDKSKETCKVLVSQCLQIQRDNIDHQLINDIVRSCIETGDTCDLCKLFIINKSPNTKACVSFTIKVLETNRTIMKHLDKDRYCGDMIKFTEKILSETIGELRKLHQAI